MLVRGGALRASSVLARRGDEVAVFDTGLAHHRASLVAALAAQGLEPDDVTLVFNTHSHVDHSHNNALFRRARIFCSRRDREWTRAMHEALARVEKPTAEDIISFYPEMTSTAYDPKIVRKVLGIEKLLWDEKCWGQPHQFVWLEDDAPPAGISVVETPGHAPHHVSYVINTSSRPVLVTGDALLVQREAHSALQLVPPYNLAAYGRSQQVINSFDGIIVPGHDEPFDNDSVSETTPCSQAT
jgi:glyoxylase-like metal-dependent hydrolase (beta-lactamase superfamily II)